MNIAMVGLGKMGTGLSRRLRAGGHKVFGYDTEAEARQRLDAEGFTVADSLKELLGRLTEPRIVWLMVPAGEPVRQTLKELAPLLERGDVIVDGGNSYYRDTLRRFRRLRNRGIRLVDVGVSGGVAGEVDGYCLMIGAGPDEVEHLEPLFDCLAPARGWAIVGRPGAGHFVKMIHNGIEYGFMQALGEGFLLLEKKRKKFEFDLARIADLWRHGSIIRSHLLDLTADLLKYEPLFEEIGPWVQDSGEGRMVVEEAVASGASVPVMAAALFARFSSRDEDSYSHRLVAGMRTLFGGHPFKDGR